VEISKKYIDKMKQWEKKLGIPYKELEDRLKKYIEEHKDLKKAWRKFRVDLLCEEGSLVSNATPFYGYLIGDSGIRDRIEELKEIALKMYNSDRQQEAIERGMVSPDGVPLDWRTKNRFGQPNPRKGLPLEGSEFVRELYAVASSTPDFERPFLARIVAYGENATNMKQIQLFKFYKFRANVGRKPRESNIITLNVGRATLFREYPSEITIEEIVNKLPVNDLDSLFLEEEYKNHYENKSRTSYLSLVRGVVGPVYLEPRNNYRSFRMISEDEDETTPWCRIPVTVPITFKRGDELIVLGRIWKSRRDGSYGLDVKGYIFIGD